LLENWTYFEIVFLEISLNKVANGHLMNIDRSSKSLARDF